MKIEDVSFSHWCRQDHEIIGHNDSEHERCPLCRCQDDRDALAAELAVTEKLYEEMVDAAYDRGADIDRIKELSARNAPLEAALRVIAMANSNLLGYDELREKARSALETDAKE